MEPKEMNNRAPHIGALQLENPFLLAPLAGITDAPMRRICRHMGASLTYSEMVSAKGLYYGDKKTDRLLFMYEDEDPVAFQIFGHEPEIMAFAAHELEPRRHSVLDINMGCPVPKVVKNGDGSALLKDPVLIEKIVAATSGSTSRPVTVKIRKGFGRDENCAVEAALAAQAGGAAAVAVHGRTREQYYTGEADWSAIQAVKEALSIPVIGNGDVTDVASAFRMMEETGCDLVMIGRGMMGNPWIFRDLDRAWNGLAPLPAPSFSEKKQMLLRQLDALVEYKGAYIAVREMRKICSWYVKGMPGSAAFRQRVNRLTDVDMLRSEIQGLEV
jgi:tRNA-dihydrouridine synthase B